MSGQEQVMYERVHKIEQTTDRMETAMVEVKERLSTLETGLTSLTRTSSDTATASMRMAAIAEERARLDAEEREARRRREERQEERSDEFRNKVTNWFGDNWKGLVLVVLLFVNPASLGKLYELGLLAPFGIPTPSAAAQATPYHPVPTSAPALLPPSSPTEAQ